MAWDSKFVNFGVVKIEGSNVKVYKDQSNYTTISVGKPVTNASWAGGELNVSMSDGKVRRYRDQSNYSTI
jgi:hypothetical protein